ncbi:hypothetical protein EWM64_g2296 [Hericium alpestre]|uniref:Uncharacterized protein n=1 Tax=Hericium alpestre TaxID=135208 RepID=A0A4Z0A652_9AGAM|nr:hypothetical protein EWM64_g2296 [Hericium alpestre]
MSELRTLHYGWSSAFGDAMSLLSATPNLKVLHLDGFTDFSNNDSSETTVVAELKNLTSFRFFVRPLRDLQFLLLRTQIAPAARLDLSLAMDGDALPRTTSWAQTVDLLAMHLRRAREVQGPFHDLALRVGLHYGAFIGWTDAFPPGIESMDERPWYTSNWEASPRHAAFSFSYGAPRNQWKKREPYLDMYRTCSRFDIMHVCSLWLSVDLSHRDSNDRELQPFLKQAAKAANWRSTLSLALNVSTLKASKDAVRGVLDALIPAASEEGQSTEEVRVLRPKLETLIIMDAQIGMHNELPYSRDSLSASRAARSVGRASGDSSYRTASSRWTMFIFWPDSPRWKKSANGATTASHKRGLSRGRWTQLSWNDGSDSGEDFENDS